MSYLKPALLLLLCTAVIYGLALALIAVKQRSFLFFPTHQAPTTSLTLWQIEEQIVGYAREVKDPASVWLMLHGNAGEAAHRDYILRSLSPRTSVYILEYPGYGLRGGSPSRASIDEAASAGYRYLRERYARMPISVIGESIGSGPACHLASESTPPNRIVLITPFSSLLALAAERLPLVPVGWLLRDRWDNIAALKGYSGPLDVYGAIHDEVIPFRHAEALARATGARFVSVASGHNDWVDTGVVRLD